MKAEACAVSAMTDKLAILKQWVCFDATFLAPFEQGLETHLNIVVVSINCFSCICEQFGPDCFHQWALLSGPLLCHITRLTCTLATFFEVPHLSGSLCQCSRLRSCRFLCHSLLRLCRSGCSPEHMPDERWTLGGSAEWCTVVLYRFGLQSGAPCTSGSCGCVVCPGLWAKPTHT